MKSGQILQAVCAVVLLAACSGASLSAPGSGEPPTVSPLFDRTPQPAPTIAVAPTEARPPSVPSGPEAAATGDLSAPLTSSTQAPGNRLVELVIYDDELNPNWVLDNSWGVRLDPAERSLVYSGAVAAAITPLEDYGAAFFSVKQGAGTTYPITAVAGVSLWINSGDNYLDPDNLAVTVIGSNDYTYWVKDDTSVQIDDLRFFSESRLGYLGITRSIPPEQWAEATVWLDRLPYEPDYQYITGVYIKNDKDFRRTFYIDRVVLLLVQ